MSFATRSPSPAESTGSGYMLDRLYREPSYEEIDGVEDDGVDDDVGERSITPASYKNLLMLDLKRITSKSYQARTIALAERILSEPGTSVGPNFVTLGGQNYPVMNFCDLVKLMTTQKNPESMPNLQPFLNFLHNVDFPVSYITNNSIKRLLRSKSVMRVRAEINSTPENQASPILRAGPGLNTSRNRIRLTSSSSSDDNLPFEIPLKAKTPLKRRLVNNNDDDDDDDEVNFRTPAVGRTPASRARARARTLSRSPLASAKKRSGAVSAPTPSKSLWVTSSKLQSNLRPVSGPTPNSRRSLRPLISPGPNRRALLNRNTIEEARKKVKWAKSLKDVEPSSPAPSSAERRKASLRKSPKKRYKDLF